MSLKLRRSPIPVVRVGEYPCWMRLPRVMVAVVAVALTCVFVATGVAKVYAPPGKAGATQYSETLPASGGNVAPPSSTPYTGQGPASAPGPIAKLGSGAAGIKHLSNLGSEGQAVAGFAQATAPTVVKAPHADVSASVSGSSAISGILSLLGGSDVGGIGLFLPVLLALALGLALGVAGQRALRR